MLTPVGPLPRSVYWRRRAVVLGAALVAIMVLWLVTGAGGGDPRATGSTGTASRPASTPTSSASGSPSASTSLAATPPSYDPGRPRDGGAGTTSGGATSGSPPAPAGTGGSGPVPAAPAAGCSDPALRLTVAAERPAYKVGATPVLILTVRNVSRVTCTRDLGVAQQEVLLYSGTSRLWSSNDCYPGGEKDVRALAPGEQEGFTVTWSGLSSRPTCAGTRTRLGAGRYALVGRIGTLKSPRAPLVLR